MKTNHAYILFAETRERLNTGGIDNPDIEARWILEDVLKVDFAKVITGSAPKLSDSHISRIDSIISDRLAHKPLQYILGHAEFYSRKFKIEPGVLVPRPETELIVDASLEFLESLSDQTPRILDLYTGCGNILLSILCEKISAVGTGVELDEIAIRCFRENMKKLRCDHATIHHEDVRDFLKNSDQKFLLITANPPYIKTADINHLMPEVRDHESKTALDGGPDGLKHIRLLAQKTKKLLHPDGVFICEIGAEQHEEVENLFSKWKNLKFREDYSGHFRVLTAQP